MDVFISYSRHDAKFAAELASVLQGQGLTVWFSDDAIKPGQNWIVEITRAIREANTFIVLLSNEQVDSYFISSEIATAIATKSEKPQFLILPVLLNKLAVVPSFINQYQYLDLSEAVNHEKKIKEIALELDARVERSNAEDDFSNLLENNLYLEDGREVEFSATKAIEYKKRAIRIRGVITASFLTMFAVLLTIILSLQMRHYAGSKLEILTLILPAVTLMLGAFIGYRAGKEEIDDRGDEGVKR